MIDDDRKVLKRIVTGDASWCFMYSYNPETKRQNETWSSPKKPKAQKVRMQKSRMKTILTAFFDAKDILITNGKQTVNGKFYEVAMKRLIALSSSR
jgi:hypothetical protein